MPRTKVPLVAAPRLTRSASKSASKSPTATLTVPPAPHHIVDRHEVQRMKKAERDELHDITLAIREVRTYMGGFTRPTQIRTANWYPGGAYIEKRKLYSPPEPSVYRPSTAYVLEGRYPYIHPVGRVPEYPRTRGLIYEGELPNLVQYANSPGSNSKYMEAMDNARWPWKERPHRRVRWWEPGEDPKELRRQALECLDLESDSAPSSSLSQEATKQSQPRAAGTELLSLGANTTSSAQLRAFHTCAVARRPDDDDRSDFDRRRQDIPGSSWSRPHKPSQDHDDNVVPSYYVERKKQRATISERKEEEGSLMAELNAGILSDELAAGTRVREEKIPVEIRLPDGTIAHPSGFQPPTPETEFHPVAAKVPTEDDPLVATVKQTWDGRDFVEAGAEPITIDPETEAEWIQRMVANGHGDSVVLTGVRDINVEQTVGAQGGSSTSAAERSKIPTSAWDTPSQSRAAQDDPDSVVPTFYIERKRQRDTISERKEEEGGLMAELNAGILSDELAAQTRIRQEKIPVEITLEDGTIAHPSGFEPPTPETDFHPTAAKPGDAIKQPWTEVLGSKKPSESRGLHTSAIARAQEAASLTALQRVLKLQGLTYDPAVFEENPNDPVLERRKLFLPKLATEPFWRPLITVTCATRPLAEALEKLCTAEARGLSYISLIPNEDRKEEGSYNSRMRCRRLNRIQNVTKMLAELLGGARGGVLGLRTKATDRGRGINGEGLADPLPKEMRMIKVGVGEWYPLAEEVKERFLADAEAGGYSEYIEVFGLDEWGMRTDGKAWAGTPRSRWAVAESADAKEEEPELDVD